MPYGLVWDRTGAFLVRRRPLIKIIFISDYSRVIEIYLKISMDIEREGKMSISEQYIGVFSGNSWPATSLARMHGI
jgi:hypothetical protein